MLRGHEQSRLLNNDFCFPYEQAKKKLPLGSFFLLLAERVRFELTVRLNVRQISSLVHSATLPPFLIRALLFSLAAARTEL